MPANRRHTGQPRDSQRQRLYTAEHSIWKLRVSAAAKRHLTDSVRHPVIKAVRRQEDGTAEYVPLYYPSVASTQDYVDAVLASAWFRRRWGFRRIEVTANPGGTSRGGYDAVHMTPEHRRHEAVLLHEIAHNLTDFHSHAYHGPEFAAVLLTLVKHQMGAEHGATLRAAYAEHRVKYRAGMSAVPKPSEARLRHAQAWAKRHGVKPRATTRTKAVTFEHAQKSAARENAPMTYEQSYGAGWKSSTGDPSMQMQYRPGFSHDAYFDGYLDNAAGRERFHLRDCTAHHNEEGGCGHA